MAENKQYITRFQDNGKIMISEDVIATIALQALTDIEGFAGLSAKPGADIAELIKKNWGKGMKITISADNEVRVDCNVLVGYGCNVVETAKEIQKNITSEVESVAGVKVTGVNVNVCGIIRK